MRFSTLIKHVGLFMALWTWVISAYAQCNDCAADTNCGVGTNFPAVCPEQIADAVAGEYYEQTLTFYIPTTVVDPQSNIEATIISVTINAVSGLPFGMSYTLNDEDGVYYPSQGQSHGCATLCGTPLLPGSYSVNVAVTAIVTAFGMEFSQNESFPTVLTVLPGESSTSTFTYDPPADCGSVTVDFDATVEMPAPAITSYWWDFGNGQTSSTKHPSPIMFDTEGEYEVSLTTTVAHYKLQSVTLENVTTGWVGDEDIIDQSPDPYFNLLSNGNIIFTSAAADNTASFTWNNLDILLDTPPYTLHFFDSDPVSNDDDLGVATIELTQGTVMFNAGNGTLGTLQIALDTTTQVTDIATVIVFPIPNADFMVDGNTLNCVDTSLPIYLWYRNGMLIPQANGPSLSMTEGGQYYVEVQNDYGCVATSSTHLYCPPITITYDAAAMELEVPNAYTSYQWTYNGLPIEGATTYFVNASQPGNYSVTVTTNYGCTITSNVYTLIVGVDSWQSQSWKIYPNPVNDFLYIQGKWDGVPSIQLYDVTGKLIIGMQWKVNQDHLMMDMRSLPSGTYNLVIGSHHARVIKQ